MLEPGDPRGVIATGFIAAGPWDFVGHVELQEGTVEKQKTRLIDRDDMVSNTMSTFVSLTVHCARCHDHKFDPIPQRDYYRLQAVFAGVERGDRLNRRDQGHPPREPVYAVLPHAPRPIHVLRRGEVEQPGEAVGPGRLSCVPGLDADFASSSAGDEGARRAALADWIASRANMLTWRSIANRVWHYHFGRGLVDTPSDFGRNGSKPTHPELLDWLAVELRDGGGSLKALHRLIVTQRRLSAVVAPTTPTPPAVDADNRWLWRMNRRRLDAEELRDGVLAVSGELDATMGGPGFELFRFQDDHSPIYDHAAAGVLENPGARRRTVYRFAVRSVPNPFLDCLDCADPEPQHAGAVHDDHGAAGAGDAQRRLHGPAVARLCPAARVDRRRSDRLRVRAGARTSALRGGTRGPRRIRPEARAVECLSGVVQYERVPVRGLIASAYVDSSRQEKTDREVSPDRSPSLSLVRPAAASGASRWPTCWVRKACSRARRSRREPKSAGTAACTTRPGARRVVQLFMSGAASQCDTFDYKPLLIRKHGQRFDPGGKVELFQSVPGAVMKSPWGWRRHGECGKWMSDLVPHLAACVDDMAFLPSMVSKSNVHGPATFMQNTGFVLPGFPSFGAWVSYGLGSLNENLPIVRRPARCPRLRPQRAGELGGGLPAGRLPGDDGQGVVAEPDLRPLPARRPRGDAREPARRPGRTGSDEPPAPSRPRGRLAARRPDRLLRAGGPAATQRPGSARPRRRATSRCGRCMAWTTRSQPTSAATA